MKGYMPRRKKFDYGAWWKSVKDDVTDAAGSAAEWSLNHSIASKVYGEFDWDDPESMNRWSKAEILGVGPGRYASARYDQMRDDELDRWKEELSAYYGINKDEIAYPIRAGLVSSGASPVSESVKSLYDIGLRKWKL